MANRHLPTDVEHAAESQRNEAVADARRAEVLLKRIAEEAGISVQEVLSILVGAGMAPDYEGQKSSAE